MENKKTIRNGWEFFSTFKILLSCYWHATSFRFDLGSVEPFNSPTKT